ncbi:Glutathione S-transferase/chloride channel C-terminal [Penicillium paradoxum]|uniref:Glutathione S-transferase/chloride channel C-terminal n=1 Tax=Penicillium paradoxum TaxID=176176 RepID=UPI00254817E9|nr:Glutathione S-transferase/chloride channel C-terminal [Penicillium paradoxum]KAJ5787590.1 Glutathione S-transferase/chloride channel C-terminal [Penicillium paradoxum]
MPLTIHHLGRSQSERIIWLAEELDIKYDFVFHKRDPIFSPQSIKDLHPSGTAPIIEDTTSPFTSNKVILAESGAIIDYIIAAYGNGRLARTPKDRDEYLHFLEWYHWANASLQPTLFRVMMIMRTSDDPDAPHAKLSKMKLDNALDMLETRLGETGAYLVGNDVTAADIMAVCTLTTMRGFCPIEFDEQKHKNILAYLGRVGERPAYQRAMKICEGEDFVPILGAKPVQFSFPY